MPDPVTLAALGGVAATEGIKFLYGQAAELLKAWREQRSNMDAGDVPTTQVTVPILDNEVLDGAPAEPIVDATVLDRERKSLVQLIGALSPYADGKADIDLADEELAEQAGRLRELLEAAYGQRFTFRGEQRDPTGTRISVRQVVGDVEGSVVGADADVGPGDLDIDQDITAVKTGGSVTGFKGRIGR
jgi:MoxR-like ATPase